MDGCQCLLYFYLGKYQYDIWNNTWHRPRFKNRSIFVGFILVLNTWRTVIYTHCNYPLTERTMLPKKKYYFCFIIEHADKIMQPIKFISTEIIYDLRVEGTKYWFEYDKSHEIFPPSIVTPDFHRISTTKETHRILHKVGHISPHIPRLDLYL